MSNIDTHKSQWVNPNINWSDDFKALHEIQRLKKEKAKEEDAKSHFDKEEFLEYILNSIELYNELIVITKETLTKGKTDLLESYVAKDMIRIKEVAHMLKGHAMTMFFRNLHKIAASIESDAINNDYEGITQQMGNIEKEIDCLIDNYLI
jgi:HPt (histidine-containing phosphotransfer) domain-containing protein